MPKKVVVSVDENSMTTTNYSNFEGATCLIATKQFHELLAQFGVQVEETKRTPKPELLAALETSQEITTQAEVEQRSTEEEVC